MPQLPDPETEDFLPVAPWRRPALIAASLSLLGLGVFVNADRLGLGDDPEFQAVDLVAQEALEQDEEGGTGQRHRGEEGKMGRPTSKKTSKLYAMKGPKEATPQMARNFDPEASARNAGIVGQVQQESGHFLASPYGAAFSVGVDGTGVVGTGTRRRRHWGGHDRTGQRRLDRQGRRGW